MINPLPMDYPYSSIHINGREVLIKEILDDQEKSQSDFELRTFDFIQRWFSDQVEFLLHTSGSTGEAKPIVITRSQMVSSALLTQQAIALQLGYTALVCLDTRYIAGQMMLVRSFTIGMKVMIVEPAANPLQKLSTDSQIDFIALVPYQVYSILESKEIAMLNNIKKVIIGGASLSQPAQEKIKSLHCLCFATYGMTETISHVALQPLNGKHISKLFHTLPKIFVSTDSRDCLTLAVPYIDNLVVTNDLVIIKDNHSFIWLGRWDNVINSGGVKISPERLEAVLELAFLSLNLHHRFIISSAPDPALGERLLLVIETHLVDEATETSLSEHISKNIAVFERPKKIVGYFPFPETNTGKIKRGEIKKMLSKRL